MPKFTETNALSIEMSAKEENEVILTHDGYKGCFWTNFYRKVERGCFSSSNTK